MNGYLQNHDISFELFKFVPLFNTFHSNISMHILYNVLYSFLGFLQGEFVYQSRVSLVGDHFLDIRVFFIIIIITQGVIK